MGRQDSVDPVCQCTWCKPEIHLDTRPQLVCHNEARFAVSTYVERGPTGYRLYRADHHNPQSLRSDIDVQNLDPLSLTQGCNVSTRGLRNQVVD
jgi:hypothetical protein